MSGDVIMKLVFDRASVDLDTISTLKNIPIGLSQQPYYIHKQNCENGCELCRLIRQKEQAYLDALTKECRDQGLDAETILKMRSEPDKSDSAKIFEKMKKFFPKRDEMRLGNGTFSGDVYLIIKLKIGDINDQLIRQYFHLSSPEFNNFKSSRFPGWNDKDIREEYMNNDALEAYSRYKHNEILV